MRAAISLNNGIYKAKELKYFAFKDSKTGKERKVGIPTCYDRAMQVLYSFSLEAISEATADRKSFAFRKCRSPGIAHAFIYDSLIDADATEWVLVTDIEAYYDTISHRWIMDNIPMRKSILKEFIHTTCNFNGELFEKDAGISLGSNLSTILGNMVLDRITTIFV